MLDAQYDHYGRFKGGAPVATLMQIDIRFELMLF
jgi:hypothetical protein